MTTSLTTSGAAPFDMIRRCDDAGEFWSARDLMGPLGYERWERFEEALGRASQAASNSGAVVSEHFRGAAKMVAIGSGATRSITDYRLTRYAAYLVAMNGDPRKPEIAAAQTYFAVRTREAETQGSVDVSSITRSDLARMIIESETAREVAEAKVADLTPHAELAQALVEAAGDYSLREAAQILARDHGIDTGQNRLLKHLFAVGVVDRNGRPYQSHVDVGRVALRTLTYEHPHTHEMRLSSQLRITGKGIAWLYRNWPRTADLALVHGGAS
jgi:DNA-damage-inducible protein D